MPEPAAATATATALAHGLEPHRPTVIDNRRAYPGETGLESSLTLGLGLLSLLSSSVLNLVRRRGIMPSISMQTITSSQYTALRGRPEFTFKINRYFKSLKLAVHEASFRREIMRKAAVPEAVRSTALI